MQIAFDAAKNDRNIAERGLSFEVVARFDFSTAVVQVDDRKIYTEVRYVAVGLLGVRLHVLCFTPIDEGIRVISFRKANSREIKAYEQTRTID